MFDVYIPQPDENGKVWLIDINPWAIRTDPLLFSWLELLTTSNMGIHREETASPSGATLKLSDAEPLFLSDEDSELKPSGPVNTLHSGPYEEPEFRIVNRDDPEAYSFNTPQYSAHKLPKDIVDAGTDGEAGLREFMGRWRDIVSMQEKGDGDSEGENT